MSRLSRDQINRANVQLLQIGGERQSSFTRAFTETSGLYNIYWSESIITDKQLHEIIQLSPFVETVIVGLFDIEKTARSRDFGIHKNTSSYSTLF